MKWKIPVSYVMNGYVAIEEKNIDTKEKALLYAREHVNEFELPASSEYAEGSLKLNESEEIEYLPDTIKLSDGQIDEIVANFSNAVEDYVLSGKLTEIKYRLNSSYDIIAASDRELPGVYYIYIMYNLDNTEICKELLHHSISDESYLLLRIKIRNILRTYCK